MDKEHIKGTVDKAKGAVKETVGKVTGDKQMQAEGRFDKAKAKPARPSATSRTPCASTKLPA